MTGCRIMNILHANAVFIASVDSVANCEDKICFFMYAT